MAKTCCLPLGCHFCPSEEEVITLFLNPKRMGQPFPATNFVIERDIYGSLPPWVLLPENQELPWLLAGDKTKKTIYVRTTLKYRFKNSRRHVARTAACGSWHSETGPKKVVAANEQVIGTRQMFVFECSKETMRNSKGHWIMHQYTSSIASSDNNYVVCKITRDDSKRIKMKKQEQTQEEVEMEETTTNQQKISNEIEETAATRRDKDQDDQYAICLENLLMEDQEIDAAFARGDRDHDDQYATCLENLLMEYQETDAAFARGDGDQDDQYATFLEDMVVEDQETNAASALKSISCCPLFEQTRQQHVSDSEHEREVQISNKKMRYEGPTADISSNEGYWSNLLNTVDTTELEEEEERLFSEQFE